MTVNKSKEKVDPKFAIQNRNTHVAMTAMFKHRRRYYPNSLLGLEEDSIYKFLSEKHDKEVKKLGLVVDELVKI